MRIKKLNNPKVEQRMLENEHYCPCKLEKTEDSKCMCKEFRDQIERQELGTCHCGLYEIVESD